MVVQHIGAPRLNSQEWGAGSSRHSGVKQVPISLESPGTMPNPLLRLHFPSRVPGKAEQNPQPLSSPRSPRLSTDFTGCRLASASSCDSRAGLPESHVATPTAQCNSNPPPAESPEPLGALSCLRLPHPGCPQCPITPPPPHTLTLTLKGSRKDNPL